MNNLDRYVEEKKEELKIASTQSGTEWDASGGL